MADDRDAEIGTRCFRLTGEVDGRRLTYDLEEGDHTIGASARCDVTSDELDVPV
jgi:hypothetical protein